MDSNKVIFDAECSLMARLLYNDNEDYWYTETFWIGFWRKQLNKDNHENK